MIVSPQEVSAFENLVEDLRNGRLDYSPEIALKKFVAFMVERPHLLLATHFDQFRDINAREYLRNLWRSDVESSERDRTKRALRAVRAVPELRGFQISDPADYETDWRFAIQVKGWTPPILGYRNPSGTWMRLIKIDLGVGSSREYFGFALESRVDKLVIRATKDGNLVGPKLDLKVPFENIIRDLKRIVAQPEEQARFFWSPSAWGKRAQESQRKALALIGIRAVELSRQEVVTFEELTPGQMEELVAAVLQRMGFAVHHVTERPQGGRDVVARGIIDPLGEPVELAVEVKHKAVVDVPAVELALYQNRQYPALLFVTSGRFTSGVYKEQRQPENRLRLLLKDGIALGDLIKQYFGAC